jgi:hypothetical protein
VPPEVTWPRPPDWTGVFTGARRVPGLLDEFDEFEFAGLAPELVPDVPELPEPEPGLAVAPLPGEPTDRELADGLPVLVTATCVEPGSTAATAPAAITLANPTVAVVAFSRRRPRSRSATACQTSRLAPRRCAEARDAPSRACGLLMLSVLHTRFHVLFTLHLREL